MKYLFVSSATKYLSTPTKISGAIAAVAFALATGGSPQAADDNGSAAVNVVVPLSIAAVQTLSFGIVAPGPPGTGDSTFVVSSTSLGNVAAFRLTGAGSSFGFGRRGVFTVSGEGTLKYTTFVPVTSVFMAPDNIAGPPLPLFIVQLRTENQGLLITGGNLVSNNTGLVGGADSI
ncbi:MAG: hypothetical protein O7A03_01855, partial [Alphaproteobacteria bacterium]|nr:hypothetical protein [Alphaproteobacteria bacterium]